MIGVTTISQETLQSSGETCQGVRHVVITSETTLKAICTAERRQISSERLRALTWLSAVDPSSDRGRARKSCQVGTGSWFLESDTYRSWLNQNLHILWLYGIPGSGKTILASAVIEDLQTNHNSDILVAYIYVDFSDSSKQSTDGLIRSFSRQLASIQDEQ